MSGALVPELVTPASAARPMIYFLCIGNAMRSQMAEAFLRHHAGDRYEAASAGTHPYGAVMREVQATMVSKGLDLSDHTSDPIEVAHVERAHLIIDLGGRGRDRIPSQFHDKFREWPIVDPYGRGQTDLVQTRDEIERRVLELIKELDAA